MRRLTLASQLLTSQLVDVALAAVLTALSLVTLVDQGPGSASLATVVLVVLSVAPVATRQTAPVASMLVIVAALAVYAATDLGDSPNGAIGMVIAMFSVATLRSRWTAALMYPTTVVVSVLVFATSEGVAWSQVAQATVVCLAAWGLGESTRRWSARSSLAAAEAARALAEERTRIAQELHDVVTHHMSVVSLQTGVAGFVLDSDRPAAVTALAAAGEASRDALVEMRRLLETLRGGDAPAAPYAPAPGLADLDALVERLRSAGLVTRLQREGPVRALPPGLELTAFRVVQESLTNVLRHAGPASARVAIGYGARVLTIEVRDDGTPDTGRTSRPGRGLTGMRERVELYGGVLEAGPDQDGGFAVVARLPVPATVLEATG